MAVVSKVLQREQLMGELRVIKAVKDFGEDYETELVNLVKRKQLEEQDNGPINDDDTDDSIGL